ncbi:tyrosine-type recombinase/integrase [Saccharicrinis sp. FJH62]|uniref:site-specific integrase n=1 Tax=Saccharicrinis sp. FJH62 TaxID=3344657 RepID=UPI0035D432E3
MGKVYFKVNTTVSDPKKFVSIRIRYKEGKLDQATATGEKCQLQYWDLSRQKFNRKMFRGKDNMVARLKKLEMYVVDKSQADGNKGKGWLLNVVDEYLHPEKSRNNGISIFEWIESYTSRSDLARTTVSAYRNLKDKLWEFNGELKWEQIDLTFYDDFKDYLQIQEYALNTVGRYIKDLKAVLRKSYERGVHSNDIFNNSAFKKVNEETIEIYLNEEELDRIYDLDLKDNPVLERSKDLFLIASWTGVRFSDLHKINAKNLQGNCFHIEQQKTRDGVIIPMHPVVKSILDKYDGKLPPVISNPKLNLHVKEIARLAGIVDTFSKSITKGGKRITSYYEKCELVKIHTARRSFATNLYKSGFPSIGIMKITGHRSESSFLKYIKVDAEENAQMMAEHWGNK